MGNANHVTEYKIWKHALKSNKICIKQQNRKESVHIREGQKRTVYTNCKKHDCFLSKECTGLHF